MARWVKADGTEEEVPVPTLTEAQRMVGGYVERVRPRYAPDKVFLCDEEGLLKNKPVNEEGCKMYGSSSPIVGDIVVMTVKEARQGGWE